MRRGQPLNQHKTQVTYNVRRGKPLDQHNATQETKTMCGEASLSINTTLDTKTMCGEASLSINTILAARTQTQNVYNAPRTHLLAQQSRSWNARVVTVIAGVALAIPVEDEACGYAILSEKVRRSVPQ